MSSELIRQNEPSTLTAPTCTIGFYIRCRSEVACALWSANERWVCKPALQLQGYPRWPAHNFTGVPGKRILGLDWVKFFRFGVGHNAAGVNMLIVLCHILRDIVIGCHGTFDVRSFSSVWACLWLTADTHRKAARVVSGWGNVEDWSTLWVVCICRKAGVPERFPALSPNKKAQHNWYLWFEYSLKGRD